jgi:hypothetical protein
MCTNEATYSRVSMVAGSGMISWCRFFVFKYKGGDDKDAWVPAMLFGPTVG